MILRRIEVRNFRKLVGPIVIDKLAKGLNIIVGDNEEGKSTLLQAVRSGFFDKYNMTGERADSFQPYNSALRPEVRITFELNGAPYTLFKAFCQHPEAELITPSGSLADLKAEEELERLLRFTRPKRAGKDLGQEHQGLFGMFWVEQGKSFSGVETNEDGRTSIHAALQKEVGEVLGGKRGHKIITAVRTLREQLFTPTGRPKGAYAEAVQRVQTLSEQLAALNGKLADYDQKLDELERCRFKLKRYSVDRSLQHAQERLKNAQALTKRVEGLQHEVEKAESTRSAAETTLALATSRWEERQKAIEGVGEAQKTVGTYDELVRQNALLLAPVVERFAREKRAAETAGIRFEQADDAFVAASAAEQSAGKQAELERLQGNERAALQAKASREEALLAANSIGLEKKHLTQLKRLEEAALKAQVQLDAVAASVRVKLGPGIEARWGESTISDETEHRITETTVVTIPETAEITIIPGRDFGNSREELARSAQALRMALATMGVKSTEEAEALAEEKKGHLAAAESYGKLAEAHAPDGVERLSTKVRDLLAEIARLSKLAGSVPASPAEAAAQLERAGQEREAASRETKASKRRFDDVNEELHRLQQQEGICKATYKREVERQQEAEERLQAGRNMTSDAALKDEVVRTAAALTAAELIAETARTSLAASEPGEVALEAQMAGEALMRLQEDIQALEIKAHDLAGELRATGATGLGERQQELQSEVAAAQSLEASFKRRAASVKLLYATLTDAEKTAKEIFLGPVAKRVQPYLKLLMPGAELELDEEMRIVALQRGPIAEGFEFLSLGTREQLAVLTRLAFADLMREHGQPAAVMLDDAIVFADDQRFDRMLRILRKAAEHLQIIVLTCRERDYVAAGAPMIRLADCLVRVAHAS